MKRRAILLALILVVVLVGNVAAAVTVPRSVIAGGGGKVTSGDFALTGTIGQPVTGVVSQGNYRLCSGFWCSLEFFESLLPLIRR